MENQDREATPIVKINPSDPQQPDCENPSLNRSRASLAEREDLKEIVIEPEPIKKKKVRGLHFPVRAFKSREDRDPNNVNEELKVGIRYSDMTLLKPVFYIYYSEKS